MDVSKLPGLYTSDFQPVQEMLTRPHVGVGITLEGLQIVTLDISAGTMLYHTGGTKGPWGTRDSTGGKLPPPAELRAAAPWTLRSFARTCGSCFDGSCG